MKWMLPLCSALTVLMLTLSSQARHRRSETEPGSFDYYLLSLSIAPSFCASSPANRAKAECRTLTEAAFQQTPLTLHGLWPNRARVSVNLQPHDCEGPPFVVSDVVQTEVARYMPAGPGLERYEWRKHGTCSGLSPETYFSTLARLGQHANATVGAALRNRHMLGETVRITDLLSAVAADDPALSSAIVVDCRIPRGGGQALVDEIRVTLSKDFQPIPAASLGMGQNSGCPGGAGRIPDVSG